MELLCKCTDMSLGFLCTVARLDEGSEQFKSEHGVTKLRHPGFSLQADTT